MFTAGKDDSMKIPSHLKNDAEAMIAGLRQTLGAKALDRILAAEQTDADDRALLNNPVAAKCVGWFDGVADALKVDSDDLMIAALAGLKKRK